VSRGARGRGNLTFLLGRERERERQWGQSLVEFALLLPILLLLVLIAVDFGRVYLGWINLQNMARIGADFASNNPTWDYTDPTALATYTNQINSDASASNCPFAPGQPAAPTYTDIDGGGIGIGDRAAVTLVCRFHVITPLISFIVGSDLNVTASSAFPVKEAIVATSSGGGGGGCLLPSPAINATPSTSGPAPLTVTFRDASGGGAGVSWLWKFTDSGGAAALPDSTARDPGPLTFNTAGTYTVTLKVDNACGSATTAPGTTITVGPANPPPPTCQVPSLNGIRFNSAQAVWGLPKPPGAGFTTTVLRAPGAPNGNFIIQSQDIVAGNTPVPCDSVIHVNNP
jgi:PKD repeat protein